MMQVVANTAKCFTPQTVKSMIILLIPLKCTDYVIIYLIETADTDFKNLTIIFKYYIMLVRNRTKVYLTNKSL